MSKNPVIIGGQIDDMDVYHSIKKLSITFLNLFYVIRTNFMATSISIGSFIKINYAISAVFE